MVITVACSKTDYHILGKSSAGFTYYWHCSSHLWCSHTFFTFQNTPLVHLSDDMYFLTVIQQTSSSTILNSRRSFMDICVMCWQVLMLNDAVCQKSENSESLIFKIMYDPLRTHQEVGQFSHWHYYVVCYCIFWFCFPFKSMEHFMCYLFTVPVWHFITLFPVPTLTFWPQGCTLLEDTIWYDICKWASTSGSGQ